MARPKQFKMTNSDITVEAIEIKVTSINDLNKMLSDDDRVAAVSVHIDTPSGTIRTQPGDFLVKLPDGDTFYGVARQDFEEFYKEITEE